MRATFSPRFRWLVMMVALGAGSFGMSTFAGAAKKPQNHSAKKARSKAPAQKEDCKTDADCVLVADDCCSCQQGGKARAIPKKQKDAYEKDRKKRCADTACTEMMSTDPSCSAKPFCGAGICELGDSGSPPSAP
jgi:hypothetical protein